MHINDFQNMIAAWAERKGWNSETINQPDVEKTSADVANIAQYYSEYLMISKDVEIARVLRCDKFCPQEVESLINKLKDKTHQGYNLLEIIACLVLIHTEVDEAIEQALLGNVETWFDETKKNKSSLPGKPEGVVPEIIDVLIRCLDLLGKLNVNTENELLTKHEYNDGRPYKHGKLA